MIPVTLSDGEREVSGTSRRCGQHMPTNMLATGPPNRRLAVQNSSLRSMRGI